MASTQEEKDLYKAKLWAKNCPQWIASAEKTGQTENEAHYKGMLAWANTYLATTNASVVNSAPPSPASPAQAQPLKPAAVAPRQLNAAEVRALQLDACTQVWRGSGKQAAARLGVPDDVFREVETAIQGEVAASWDSVVTTNDARFGVRSGRN